MPIKSNSFYFTRYNELVEDNMKLLKSNKSLRNTIKFLKERLEKYEGRTIPFS